jgi:ParB-like chromosome segregation protein Spo0J
MSGVRHGFEQTTLMLSLEQITPTRRFTGNVRITSKYKSILSSIREVGIIEPLVVFPERPSAADGQTQYLLLDGHLRLESLKELCLISTDDESFTYNRQVSRLSTVQEHLMITRAIDRGVIPERIAAALNVDVRRIHERHRLLEGIVPEVVSLLKDRQVSRGVFPMLRRMKPMRQIEAAEMMVSANLFTRPYAEMLLATTRAEHLINSDKQKSANTVSAEDILRMERELDKVNQDHKLAEDTLGENMLFLVVAKGYVQRLFRNKAVNDYLKRHYKDLTGELQEVIEAVTADARSVGRE